MVNITRVPIVEQYILVSWITVGCVFTNTPRMMNKLNVKAVLLWALAFGELGYSLWPKPQSHDIQDSSLCLIKSSFYFEIGSDVSTSHMRRLQAWIDITNSRTADLLGAFSSSEPLPVCAVQSCNVRVTNPASALKFDRHSEAYQLTFSHTSQLCEITCNSAYGCRHGVSTFFQLLDPVDNFAIAQSFQITDEPAFAHRGSLIDTSRHFLPVSLIEQHIDLMALVKMNVLHWHVVDDHSFPLEIKAFPALSGAGAFSPYAVYTRADVEHIIEYAGNRGIYVLVEVDMPGHVSSWFKGYPELQGYSLWTALDPTREANYAFIETLLTEVVDMFKTDLVSEQLIHLGGDETWNSWDTAGIRAWMAVNGMKGFQDLIGYWFQRLTAITAKFNVKVILWEDFLHQTGDVVPASGDNVIWTTWLRDFPATSRLGASTGKQVIFAKDFYIFSDRTWADYYAVDLSGAHPTVIGAEACLWGEWVDENNFIQRAWRSTAAVAERLWCGSTCSTDPTLDATLRLAAWRCRTIELLGLAGIEPVGTIQAKNAPHPMPWSTDKSQFWCEEKDPQTLWKRFKTKG